MTELESTEVRLVPCLFDELTAKCKNFDATDYDETKILVNGVIHENERRYRSNKMFVRTLKREDGCDDVVVTGSSGYPKERISYNSEGRYFLIVRHRRHEDTSTVESVFLSEAGKPSLIELRKGDRMTRTTFCSDGRISLISRFRRGMLHDDGKLRAISKFDPKTGELVETQSYGKDGRKMPSVRKRSKSKLTRKDVEMWIGENGLSTDTVSQLFGVAAEVLEEKEVEHAFS